MVVGGQSHDPAALPREIAQLTILEEAGLDPEPMWTGVKKVKCISDTGVWTQESVYFYSPSVKRPLPEMFFQ
jgi:hypothetical protein